jgi:hypothetical protein
MPVEKFSPLTEIYWLDTKAVYSSSIEAAASRLPKASSFNFSL